jgi:hypothetical protein
MCFLSRGKEHKVAGHPVHNLVAVLTEVFRLQISFSVNSSNGIGHKVWAVSFAEGYKDVAKFIAFFFFGNTSKHFYFNCRSVIRNTV